MDVPCSRLRVQFKDLDLDRAVQPGQLGRIDPHLRYRRARGLIGGLRPTRLYLRAALAPVKGPLLTLGAIRKNTDAVHAAVGIGAHFQRISLFLTVDGRRICRPGIVDLGPATSAEYQQTRDQHVS